MFLWLDNSNPNGGIVCDAGSSINARDSSVIWWALILIQVKVLQVNLEERDSLEWTGLLQTPAYSIVQKPGKLSDQGHQLLVDDGQAYFYYPKACIHLLVGSEK